MATDYTQKPWIQMSLEELQTPRPGKICKGPAWWAVQNGNVFFFKNYTSPQCNAVRELVERIHPDCEPVFVEMAFVPFDYRDYV